MNRSFLSLLLVCAGLLAPAGTPFAQSASRPPPPPMRPGTAAPASLPDWDHLSPAQRDAIVAVVRERWNGNPGQRARMLQHAERWRQMTPDQRRQAMHGQHRWEQMSPEERERALSAYRQSRGQGQPRNGGLPPDQRRELQDDLRSLPQDDRRELRQQYRAMPPEQREQARRQWESMTPEQRREWLRNRRRNGQGSL